MHQHPPAGLDLREKKDGEQLTGVHAIIKNLELISGTKYYLQQGPPQHPQCHHGTAKAK